MDLDSSSDSLTLYQIKENIDKMSNDNECRNTKSTGNKSSYQDCSRDVAVKAETCRFGRRYENAEGCVKLEPSTDYEEACERERQKLFEQMLLLTNVDYEQDEESNEPKEVDEEYTPKKRIRKKGKTKVKAKKKTKVPAFCSTCNKTFKKMANLNRHNRSVHAENEESGCRICFKVFKSKIHLRFHERKVHSELFEPQQECLECPKVFKSKAYLKRHMEEVHPDTSEMVQCQQCSKEFKSNMHLNIHMKRVHSPDPKRCTCTICGKTYSCTVYLRRHMEIVHTVNSSPYVCSLCTMPFFLEKYLLKHMKREHEDNQNLQCMHCNRYYQNEIKLKRHLYTAHTSRKRPVICQICGKSYKSIETLKAHMKNLHCDQDSVCSCYMCGAIFKCQVYLNKHIRLVHKLSYFQAHLVMDKVEKSDLLNWDLGLNSENENSNNDLSMDPIHLVECNVDFNEEHVNE